MRAFHERLARVGLVALSDYGFALAGGYAVQAHGLVSRLSEDVDLFTTMDAADPFEPLIRARFRPRIGIDRFARLRALSGRIFARPRRRVSR